MKFRKGRSTLEAPDVGTVEVVQPNEVEEMSVGSNVVGEVGVGRCRCQPSPHPPLRSILRQIDQNRTRSHQDLQNGDHPVGDDNIRCRS